ncbi:MAG: hypothetical protein WAL32_14785 [Terriglobales bacterium]
MTAAHITPALDEATFQQMLEAAYVLQERSESPSPAPPVHPPLDPAETLAEIAATQQLLRSKDSDLRTSARVVAERLQKITSAIGVAVAIIHEDQLEYFAAVGNAASLAGMAMPIDSSLSEFLQTAATNPALINELLKRHDSKSPFLFPVYHEGTVSGFLDVRFPECDAICGQEVQSCQVMAGLMGEAVAKAAKLEWKQAMAVERATMLEVLERLRPQLERLAAEPVEASPILRETIIETPEPAPESASPEIEALLSAITQANEKDSASSICGQCGYQFGESELFCGRCGTPRLMESPATAPDSPAKEFVTPKLEPGEAGLHLLSELPPVPFPEPALTQFFNEVDSTDGTSALALSNTGEAVEADEPQIEEQKPAIVHQPDPPAPATWTSANHALKWLQSLEQSNSPGRIWLARHSGDISIAVAALVLLLALTGWGLHPNLARTAPRLTLFERMLVDLGLAEAPPPPIAAGNPNVWVWVDVHTALYYCPGSDLYGKTEGGKFALQHDAQLDQFQPAARKNCE